MNKIAIIGGGAAGMMAAIAAAESGAKVTLIEKNERLGKKLYITGKGRCNLTNDCEVTELFDNITKNPKFLYSAIYGYDNYQVQEFFKDNNVPLKVERGLRVFPESDKANDIITALERKMKQLGVEVMLNTMVKDLSIIAEENKSVNSKVKLILSGKKELIADKVIIATGGASYESTGSTGDGYRFAKTLGHNIKDTIPSLVPFNCSDEWIKELQGLALKNVSLKAYAKGKEIFDEFGEMLFTHFGISGPLVLSCSSKLCERIKAGEKIEVYIDLKPALNEAKLDERILRDFEQSKNKNFENAIGDLFPKRLCPVMINLSGIDPYKKVHEILREERQKFVELIKKLPVNVTSLRGMNEAIITRGGIDVKQVDPSTMESKLVPNVYFAGEVLDVDAVTGGFNLQIAWSTGHLAGQSAAE